MTEQCPATCSTIEGFFPGVKHWICDRSLPHDDDMHHWVLDVVAMEADQQRRYISMYGK